MFVPFIRLVPFSHIFVFVAISRSVLRPAISFYTVILKYIYVFFNRMFLLLDGNRCHSLNCPSHSLSHSLSLYIYIYSHLYNYKHTYIYTKLLFRGGPHLRRRTGTMT